MLLRTVDEYGDDFAPLESPRLINPIHDGITPIRAFELILPHAPMSLEESDA